MSWPLKVLGLCNSLGYGIFDKSEAPTLDEINTTACLDMLY